MCVTKGQFLYISIYVVNMYVRIVDEKWFYICVYCSF